MKQMITMPADWQRQQNGAEVDTQADIHSSSYTEDEVVQDIEVNKIKICEAIIRRTLHRPHTATHKDFQQYFQTLFSIKLDSTDLENSLISTIRAFDSLPPIDEQYQQLDDKQQITIKIMRYIDTTLTKIIDHHLEDLKPFVRDSFVLLQNTPDVIRLFNDIEGLARMIFSKPELKQLRAIFQVDVCHFDEIANQYDFFGDEGCNLIDMAMTQTKRVVGIDFSLKRIDPSVYFSTFQEKVAFVSKEYPQKAISYLLFEASICGNTEMYTEVIDQIVKMDFAYTQVSQSVDALQDDAFLYSVSPQRSGSLQMMQQKTRALLGLQFKLKVMEQLRCCVLNIAATMMHLPHVRTKEALQTAIHKSQRQSLSLVLNMVPYCNSKHIQEVISITAKAVLTARKYQPRFLTYRFLTEQVQFRLKIAKIVALKERMHGRSEESSSASSSQTISDEGDLQFVLKLDNFSNEVNFRLKQEDQQFFLNIVEETISHLGISKQDAKTWKKSLVKLYCCQLRSQPSSRPNPGQLDRYFHHIKLMLFSNYCQKSMKKYLTHQQQQLIFNQDPPDPERILRQLNSVTPHYLGEWT